MSNVENGIELDANQWCLPPATCATIDNEAKTEKQKLLQKAIERHTLDQSAKFNHFVKTNFSMNVCRKFIKTSQGSNVEVCNNCGASEPDHGNVSKLIGTNCCGRMTFSHHGLLFQSQAEYLRVSDNCSNVKLWKMLLHSSRWDTFMINDFNNDITHIDHLSMDTDLSDVNWIEFWGKVFTESTNTRPALVVSMIGTADLPDNLKHNVFKDGLIAAIQSTNGCILTDGLQRGMTIAVAKAVEKATTKLKPIRCFGFPPWSRVKYRTILEARGINYQSFVQYPTHEVYREDGRKDQYLLAPNHSRLIFVDDGKYNAHSIFTSALQFRAKFEQYVASMETGSPGVPVVRVLVQGSEESIEEVLIGLEKGIDLLVCQNSGGLADLILFVKQEFGNFGSEDLKSEVIKKCGDLNLALTDSMIENIMQCGSIYSHLIVSHDVNSPGLESAMFSVMLKKYDTFENKFAVAVKYNQLELAKSLALNETVEKANENFLTKLVLMSLVHDKLPLFKMISDLGCRVGAILRNGDEAVLFQEMFKMKQFSHLSKLNLTRKGVGFDRWENIFKTVMSKQFYIVEREWTNMVFDSHLHQLFFWAVLFNRKEQIMFFWKQIENPIGGAIIASMICQSVIDQQFMTHLGQLCEDYQATKKMFDEYAACIVNIAYDKNQELTLLLLNRPDRSLGGLNLITLAATSRNMAFLATSASQRVVFQKWRNGFNINHGYKLVWCAVLIFPIFWIDRFIVPGAKDYCRSCEALSNCKCETLKQHYHQEPDKWLQHTLVAIEKQERNHIFTESRYSKLTSDLDFKQDQSSNKFEILKQFYNAPMVKTGYSLFFFILFYIHFAYVVLFSYHWKFTIAECCLYVAKFGLFIKMIRTIVALPGDNLRNKCRMWWCCGAFSVWNRYYVLIFGLALFGFILRMFEQTFQWSKVILCLNMTFFMTRIFKTYMAYEYLGPKLVMVYKTIYHGVMFCFIFGVFFASYAISAQALQHPARDFTGSIFWHLFQQGIWDFFGDLNEDSKTGQSFCDVEVEHLSNKVECQTLSWPVPTLLVLYLFFGAILLANILIATFTNIFEQVQSHGEQIFRYQKYWITEEYSKHSVLFFLPYLNLIDSLLAIVEYFVNRGNKKELDDLMSYRDSMLMDSTLFSTFEMQCRDDWSVKSQTTQATQTI